MKEIKDVIYLLDLEEKPSSSLSLATDIEVEHVFGGVDVIEFVLPLGVSELVPEQQLIYRNKRYKITEIEESKVERLTRVIGESLSIELNDIYVPILQANGMVMQKIAEKILSKSKWTVGTVDFDNDVHYMVEENESAMYLLKKLAKISDFYVEFDTLHRRVNLRKDVGENLDFIFRYKKNLREVKKITFAPKATRLKPLGRGGLTIASVNEGSPYIEDYTWYESLGMDIKDAKKNYEKTHLWSDERYIYAGNLMRAGKKKLRELSHPRISYETEIAYLNKDVDIGDYGYVVDEELGIKVQVRVVRLIEYEDRKKGKIEFNYLIPGLQDREDQDSNNSVSEETNMILVKNEYPVTVRSNYQLLLEMSITAFKSTNAQVGLLIVGHGSNPGVIEGYFQIDDETLQTQVRQTIVGWTTIGMPFLIPQLQDGSHKLQLFVKSSTDFEIEIGQAQLYLVAENLLGGLSSDIPSVNVVEEVEYNDDYEITDQVTIDLIVPERIQRTEKVVYTDYDVGDRVIDIMVSIERDEFAKVHNYPHLASLPQDVIDAFVDVYHNDKKSFVLLKVGEALALLASRDYIYIDPVTKAATATSDMFLLDLNNENTNVGRIYKSSEETTRLEVYNRG